ncbi:DUF2190 family protein [Entomomonas sp. E2T0]|uniref:capsid cement protein n=1 Tax=Entomomonas sp. E2T0 TaxID=2930213 RepID=UPI0022284827|nr:capsid cement protein [Entomomonas sp. E2T0]UYZ84290.1 DUF2190 family protein [Entomomonas sp. E2T0]
MHIPQLISAFMAITDIEANLIVATTGNDGEAKQATAATDYLLGTSSEIGVTQGRHVSVIRSGLSNVVYGGTIAIGDPVTSDAQGRAIKATAGDKTIGFAEVAGVEGDIGSIYVTPGVGV